MLIDFTKVLLDIKDEPILDENDEGVTLATVCIQALTANTEEVSKLSGEKKIHRAVLAHAIHTEQKLDVIAEDVTLLKDAVGKAYTPVVVWRACDLLDPKLKEVKEAK